MGENVTHGSEGDCKCSLVIPMVLKRLYPYERTKARDESRCVRAAMHVVSVHTSADKARDESRCVRAAMHVVGVPAKDVCSACEDECVKKNL